VRLDRWCGKPGLIVWKNPMVTVIAWEMPHGNAKWSIYGRGHIPPYPNPPTQRSPGCLPIIQEDPGSQRLHMETQVLQDGCKEFVPRLQVSTTSFCVTATASLCKNWLNWCFGLD
jgi:hypothetical protein